MRSVKVSGWGRWVFFIFLAGESSRSRGRLATRVVSAGGGRQSWHGWWMWRGGEGVLRNCLSHNDKWAPLCLSNELLLSQVRFPWIITHPSATHCKEKEEAASEESVDFQKQPSRHTYTKQGATLYRVTLNYSITHNTKLHYSILVISILAL